MRLKHVILILFSNLSILSFGQKLNMDTLSTWSDNSLTATDAHKNVYNEVWGYAQDGKEYGIIGSTHGTHIIDVTDPKNSSEVVFVPGNQPTAQYSQVVHRDYHTYKNYLYMVSDEGTTNLKIVDLSDLPNTAPVLYNSNALFSKSHNIFIDTTGAKLYVCGAFNGFAVYSLSNPELPTLIYDNPSSTASWSSDMGYVHDVYVRNDTAYMNSEGRGIFVTDFSTDPPTFLGSLTTYPHQGYNHSGWLAPEQDVYVLADENHGKDLKVLDVSDLTDMSTITTFNNAIDPTASIPHNVIIEGNLVYVSYYFDGVYVFDITDPINPETVAFYDTSTEPNMNNFRGCWGVYPYLPSGIVLASDMQNGLFIFNGDDIKVGLKEQEIKPSSWSVYPTVFENQITIENMQPIKRNTSYFISNILGEIILEGKLNTSKTIIKSGELSAGVYVVNIIDNGNKTSTQVIKE